MCQGPREGSTKKFIENMKKKQWKAQIKAESEPSQFDELVIIRGQIDLIGKSGHE